MKRIKNIISRIKTSFAKESKEEEESKEQEKNEGLTIKKLRKYKGLENVTDEEGEQIIASIKTYCDICLQVIATEKNKEQYRQAA